MRALRQRLRTWLGIEDDVRHAEKVSRLHHERLVAVESRVIRRDLSDPERAAVVNDALDRFGGQR